MYGALDVAKGTEIKSHEVRSKKGFYLQKS